MMRGVPVPDTVILTEAHLLGCNLISLTYPVDHDQDPTTWRVSSPLGARAIELTALPLNLMSLVKPEGAQGLIDTIGKWLDRPLIP